MSTEDSSQRRTDQKIFEETLLRTLASGTVSDELAKELVAEISSIDALRNNPVKPFPKGVVVLDGIGVDVVLDRDGIRDLTRTLVESKRIDRLEIFPYGIIDPDIFIGRIEFGF